MDILHKLLLGVEIYAIAATSLVVLSLTIGTIRGLFNRNAVPFSYPQDVPAASARAQAEGYLHRILVALDIFLNVVFLLGQQDETMSTHAWRASLEGRWWGKAMNWWLNGFQAQHGPQAASGDLERASVRVATLVKALNLNQ